MRLENYLTEDLIAVAIACSTEVGYGEILEANKLKLQYNRRSSIQIYGSSGRLAGIPNRKNVARPLFILGIFLLCFSGIGLSQSLDSLTKIKLNKAPLLDTLTILDSLNQFKASTMDSLNRISQKVDDFRSDINQNRDFENVVGEKWDISIPKIPSMDLPKLKLPELTQKRLGGPTKVIEEIVTRVFNDTGKIGTEISAIGSAIDSLRNIENIDSTLLKVEESGMDRIEQEIKRREELSGIPESADIKSSFSGKLAEGGFGEGTSELQTLNPKQIQQEYFPDLNKVKEAQVSLDKYKAKYNELNDSRMEDEGVKRHSLEESTFSERSEFSLLGSFSSFKPFVFQTSAGYRIDRHWTAGVGAIWTTGTKVKVPDWTGMRAFGQYWIKESVFLQAEYQNLSGSGALEEQKKSRSALLGGLGTEVQLYRSIRLRSAVLYRVNKLKGFESQWQTTVGIVFIKK